MDTLLLVIALAVGVILASGAARVIRVPAPLLLVAAGILIALIPGVPNIKVDPHVVLFVLLPPLLYAAALDSSLIAIRANARSVAMLAVGLVLVTAFAVGAIADPLLPGVAFAAGVALGAIVAPPDAVAASAVARRTGMPRRIVTVLEGESLFNDATSLVLLRVATGAVAAGSVSALHAAGEFAVASIGGAALGAVAGVGISWLRRRGVPTLVNTALSLVAPFGIYYAGEEAHSSGVIAVVVTGLILAHNAPTDADPATRLTDQSIWGTLQFLLEGAVFALVGLQLPHIAATLTTPASTVAISCVAVVGVVLLIRPLWIFLFAYIVRIAPWTQQGGAPKGALVVLSWAGMRGVVSLAAAQSLPLDFPKRDLILFITAVVIVSTLGLQGMTLPWVIRRSDVRPPDPRQDALQVATAQEQAGDAALQRLAELATEIEIPEEVLRRIRQQIEYRTYSAWEVLGDSARGETPTQIFARIRTELIGAERQVFIRLRDSGELEDEVLRRVQRRLDLEESLLANLDSASTEVRGHQEVLPEMTASSCTELQQASTDVPVAEPSECPDCKAEGRSDWVHLRVCLTCDHVGCCDSSPARHADAHYHQTRHPVMGSAEPGEGWRWCYEHKLLG